MATKLFVGGLSWDTTDDSLKTFFAQAGNVVSASVISDKFTGRSKGFGFVEMGSEEEAKETVAKLNGQMLDGRAIAVNEARPQVPRSNDFRRPDRRPGQGSGGFNRDRGPRRSFSR